MACLGSKDHLLPETTWFVYGLTASPVHVDGVAAHLSIGITAALLDALDYLFCHGSLAEAHDRDAKAPLPRLIRSSPMHGTVHRSCNAHRARPLSVAAHGQARGDGLARRRREMQRHTAHSGLQLKKRSATSSSMLPSSSAATSIDGKLRRTIAHERCCFSCDLRSRGRWLWSALDNRGVRHFAGPRRSQGHGSGHFAVAACSAVSARPLHGKPKDVDDHTIMLHTFVERLKQRACCCKPEGLATPKPRER